MTNRLVVGIVSRTDGTPWRNAKVTFRRCQGTYTPTNQYPPDTIIAYTNQDGELYSVIDNGNVLVSGVNLWCNAEGAGYTPYECQLPNDSFTFKLPIGNAPISLSVLREGSSNSTQPQYESIIDYVDTSIEKAINQITQGGSYYQNFIINSNNEILFTLTNIPQFPNKSKVYLNGLKQQFGIDYNINLLILNWISNNTVLKANYILEVYY